MSAALIAVIVAAAAAACGERGDTAGAPSQSHAPTAETTVPPEFLAACGKPGSEVTTRRTHVVIPRSACDLTGVVIMHDGRGVEVPAEGGNSAGAGVSVVVAPTSGDVTFTATD